MPQRSAGVLLYRRESGGLSVLLVHPGGPFWRKRDAGAWQIPKGLIEADETPEMAARREAEEELGVHLEGRFAALGEVRQAGGKYVVTFALEADLDPATVRSNCFTLEWPPKSGRMTQFPEVDRAAWFSLDEAAAMMLPSQRPFLERLAAQLAVLAPRPVGRHHAHARQLEDRA